MSLITQCPACATMFRVVPDQLRISEGWVRCGQCDEVFDANAHLQSLPSVDTTPPLEGAALQAPPNTAPVAPVAAHVAEPVDAAYDWGDLDTGTASLDSTVALQVPPATESLQVAEEPIAEAPLVIQADAEPADSSPTEDSFLSHNPHDLSVAEEAMAEQYAATPAPTVAAAEVAPMADESPLSFMPRAEKQTRWARWLGTPLWLGAITIFTVLLTLQVLVHERDRLAAAYPDAQPAFDAMCGVLGCELAAPRHIESIAIESSSFNSVKPGVFLLSVTLKNAGAWGLEMPALELTLTDRQDQVVLRRVLRAADYAGTVFVIDAGAERALRMPVQVTSSVSAQQIAGYKLLAFYP